MKDNGEKERMSQGVTQRRSVLTPEGQIEQAGRFARGLRTMDRRRRRLLSALLIVICLPTLIVALVSAVAWVAKVFEASL